MEFNSSDYEVLWKAQLPDWADRRILPEEDPYAVVNAQLPTRDGRRVGNARVVEAFRRFNEENFSVKTDAGNQLILCRSEMEELFHPPAWVMRDEKNK